MPDYLKSDWPTLTVRDLIENHFCGPSPDCEERQIFAEQEWGVLKTTAITWTGWNDTAHKVLPKSFWGQSNIEVHSGDVLVTKAGPRNRVGVVCYVPSTRNRLVVSGKMIGLRPNKKRVLPEILSGLISRTEPQKYIQDRTTGMAESQVNFANEVLLDTPLCVPPITEQAVIAKIIRCIDVSIQQTNAIVEKLKQVKQGLLDDFLTQGVDANGKLRPSYEQAPQLYKKSLLGVIPKEWEVCRLEDMTKAPICYGIVQVQLFVPTGVPVLAIKNLLGDYINGINRTSPRIEGSYSRSRVTAGDVLISIKGTIGRIGVVPKHFSGNISRDIALLRPADTVRTEFLAQLLRSPVGQKILSLAQVGTTRAELSIAPLKKLCFASVTWFG